MTTDSDHILKLAEIIREVNGGNRLGAAALAEAILSHPGSRWSPAIQPEPEIVPSGQLPGRRNPFVSDFQQQINDALDLYQRLMHEPPWRQSTPSQAMNNPPLDDQNCDNCRYQRMTRAVSGEELCCINPPRLGDRGLMPLCPIIRWCGGWVAR